MAAGDPGQGEPGTLVTAERGIGRCAVTGVGGAPPCCSGIWCFFLECSVAVFDRKSS